MLKELLRDIGISATGDVISIGILKKILTKSLANMATGGTTEPKASAVTTATKPEGTTPPVSFGGIFDYSDEEAFWGLLAKMNADKKLAGAAEKVSRFLNDGNRFSPGQRRKFRAVVGNLGRIEYAKRVKKTRTETPKANAAPTVEEKTVETKSNLGIEFMRGFAAYNDDQMMEICKAGGIHDSVIDNVADGLTHFGRRVAKAAEAIEKSPVAQTIMTGLVARMRADRARIAAKKTTHTP